jgi:hypothetical protein
VLQQVVLPSLSARVPGGRRGRRASRRLVSVASLQLAHRGWSRSRDIFGRAARRLAGVTPATVRRSGSVRAFGRVLLSMIGSRGDVHLVMPGTPVTPSGLRWLLLGQIVAPTRALRRWPAFMHFEARFGGAVRYAPVDSESSALNPRGTDGESASGSPRVRRPIERIIVKRESFLLNLPRCPVLG